MATKKSLIHILLVDDHIPTREQIKALLCTQPDMDVIAESGSAEEALDKARELLPDIVIMDIMLPGMNGIEATRQILEERPDSKIIVLSNHSVPALIHAVFEAGGLGYVSKNRASEQLIEAIRCVSNGTAYTCNKPGL